jgi:hypothetical protein
VQAAVTPGRGLTVASGPQITLELNIEEFAMLESLRFRGLSGNGDLRDAIDEGFAKVMDEIEDNWKRRVQRAGQSLGVRRIDAQDVSKVMRARG